MLTQQQKNIYLTPINKPIKAILDLPGSKSIANRVLPLAAIADGISIIHNIPDVAEDVQLMLEALVELGIKITKLSTALNGCSSYQIEGCGGKFPKASADLFLGNSGTSIRFLSAILAVSSGEYSLTGIQRMKERPIGDLVNALCQLGCNITYLENEAYPPLQISPFCDNQIKQISISGKISSQYLTGLLLAMPLLGREIQIKIYDELISRPYVEITLALLKLFAIEVVELETNLFAIKTNSGYKATEYTVEPDASSASYFLAMATLAGQVQINNLSANSLQGDKNFAQVLALMGSEVKYASDYIECRQAKNLIAIDVDMEDMPDVAMTVAILALFAEGVTTIRGIASWKVKETDRLIAIATELTKLGATVNYTNDSISILPPQQINSNIAIDTYNDHRMAMCFSLLAVGGISVVINDFSCVGKTFANYFELFDMVVYQ
ncbi:MAG: 3-phosphoshikimate 1-carboxyvinyltransferase [Pseudomonadota bacterium]|jgi:3-phosphoshikimate 1-carboxyvinyltransferase